MFESDKPKQTLTEDQLGVAGFAIALGESIVQHGGENGLVIGLYGAWGSGKTTIINMMIDYIETKSGSEKPIIVRFNPWSFSGQDQLYQQFFNHLSSILEKSIDVKENLKKAGQLMSRYGGFLSKTGLTTLLGPIGAAIDFMGHSGKAIDELIKGQEQDLLSLKREITQGLAEAKETLLVVIDDVDRLSDIEIGQVFQLVKSVADFPYVIYLLAFDDEVVVQALSRVQEGKGEVYLEKVVQVPFSIPAVSNTSVERLLRNYLSEIIEGFPAERWEKDYWERVASEFYSFFNSVRDVNRYLNVARFYVVLLRDEVNPVDFLVSIALQVFEPTVFKLIRENEEHIIGQPPPSIFPTDVLSQRNKKESTEALNTILKEHSRLSSDKLNSLDLPPKN